MQDVKKKANSICLVLVLHVKFLYMFLFSVNLLIPYLNIIYFTTFFALNIPKIQFRSLQYFYSITLLVKGSQYYVRGMYVR
jgi:hypothetical protein